MSSVVRTSRNPCIAAVDLERQVLKRTVAEARRRRFAPSGTMRNAGAPLFRRQLSRDLGCLLDLDRDIVSWRCLPRAVWFIGSAGNAHLHVPDFEVVRIDGSRTLLDAMGDGAVAGSGASDADVDYEQVDESFIRAEPRLSNVKELLGYTGTSLSLGDRVRFLAVLDENGPTPLADCLHAFRHVPDPMAAVAGLALRRFVLIDLEDAPIGPETLVRRSHP
ncbi:hypothetical protein [Inquilinus sp. CAU 1745]|uniref:hypothetical protein n=1 Tax=Inquilinus sp. CAU 1745 TaxID=3140369 RepID=UPI00325BA8BB